MDMKLESHQSIKIICFEHTPLFLLKKKSININLIIKPNFKRDLKVRSTGGRFYRRKLSN